MSLRILMTLDAIGGVWRYAMDLGTALAGRGHIVVFAGLGPHPSAAQRAEALRIGQLEWGIAPLDWMAEGPEATDDVGPWIEAMIRRHQPDLLHLNLPSQAAAVRTDIPIVTVSHSCLASWFHVVEARAVPQRLAWLSGLTAKGMRRAAVVIAPTVAHGQMTARFHGRRRVIVVPNASSSPQRLPSPGADGAVAVARWWDKAKNAVALDEAARLGRTRITLIGSCDGADGQSFRPRFAGAAGELPHAATVDRIAAAEMFVSPSLYEPFGLAALEAARAARPLILADIPVYRELWQGAARFFDPRDPASLARQIDALSAAPEDRRLLGRAASRRAARYTLDRQAAAMDAIYRRVARNARAA